MVTTNCSGFWPSYTRSHALYLLIEQFFRLVDLGGQVGTAASIGMVEQHHGSVSLADLVLGERTFTEGALLNGAIRFP